jgi:hypothetical protein
MQCGGLMKVTIELRAGRDHHDPFKEDIDKNLEAMERAIKGKMIGGDDILLRDTASILNGIKMRLTSNPRTAFNNWSSREAHSVTFEPLVILRQLVKELQDIKKQYNDIIESGSEDTAKLKFLMTCIEIKNGEIARKLTELIGAI